MSGLGHKRIDEADRNVRYTPESGHCGRLQLLDKNVALPRMMIWAVATLLPSRETE